MKIIDLLLISPTDMDTEVVLQDRNYRTIKVARTRNTIFTDPQFPDLADYLEYEICEWYLDSSDLGEPRIHIVLPISYREHQAYISMTKL